MTPSKPTLHTELVARLRDMIVEGELKPGARVPERELCQRFRISRTPLREALKVLASEGLIVLLPRRGARVAKLTRKDVEDMFEVMGMLESLAGELASARIDEAAIDEIRALHHEMLAHYLRRDLPGYFRLNQRIHESVVAAAGNPLLSALYSSLSGRIRRARYLANISRERWAQAVAEHEAILAALTRRDGPALAAILREHLRHKCDVVLNCGLIEDEGAAAAPAHGPVQEPVSIGTAGSLPHSDHEPA